jgi:hypothetical protein
MSQITEAQIKAAMRFYTVLDPAGTPQDAFFPAGSVLGGFYKIAPSVTSSNLTVALQHLDGTDPSTTNPLGFKIGNDWQLITAALSTTKNAATNWANLGSAELSVKNHDLFVYVIQETGASAGTKIGFSRIPFAVTMADFSSTSTNEKYIAGSYTNFNATDEVTNIGRFRAQLSATAAFTWSFPSAKVIHRPIFETDWLTWQPAFSASGSMTYTTVTTDLAQYKIRGTEQLFEIKAHGTTGGVASTLLAATYAFGFFGSTGYNFSKYDNSNFGLGANRYIAGTGQYKIG